MTLWGRNRYQAGGTWAICDRCGFRHRLSELKTEWTNLKVCESCHDPRPEQLDAPYIDPKEGAAIPNSRPDTIEELSDDDLLDPDTVRGS